jgi:peptidyl-prolyl cis-trans isomerase C
MRVALTTMPALPRFRMPPIRPAALVGWARRGPIVPKGRRVTVVFTVLLALVAIGSGTAIALDRINGVPTGAAFRVGDTVVSIAALDDRVRLLGALYGVQAPTDPGQLDQFRRDSAKAIAVSDVLDNAALAQGVVIADKAASDELTRLIQTSFPQGRDAFVAQLGTMGLSEQNVLDEVKRQLANAQLYDKITAGVPLPTDAEVAGAYTARKAQMVTPEKRHLLNIVVASQAAAAQVRAQLDGGADFATVAAASSQDQSTKNQGGDLGTVTRDQLEQAYGDAAYAAPANTLFGPVQTQYGWNVGKVLQVTASTPLTLDQVRDALRSQLADERKTAVWNDWLSTQIKNADVRYADAYRPADPDGTASATDPGIPGGTR